MPIRVLKFGGTSVESPEQILAVARRILAWRNAGDPIVVVVSAMGQTTDELIRLAERVSRTPSRRELDMLLTAGERISMALLAMSLESLGCPAVSFTGSQVGLITDTHHADARIHSVRAFRIRQELEKGRVVIVAGFQGVSADKEVTTLGRGGSDTTAVALAIHLGAERCEIYIDVPGVYSADPRIVPRARILDAIDYAPMIALSHLGGRVLYRRAVLLARKFALPIEVLAAREERPGTRIPTHAARPEPRRQEEEPMESDRLLGVAVESPVHWVRVRIPSPAARSLPASGAPLFLTYAESTLEDGARLVQFAAPAEADLGAWIDAASWGEGARVEADSRAALVSLVGEGILSAGDRVRQVASLLDEAGIAWRGIHTGTLALSVVVAEEKAEDAARVLHRKLLEAK